MKKILLKIAKTNKNLVILNTRSTKLDDFTKFFPNRIFTFGMAEANMVSCSAGFTITGNLPLIIGNAEFLPIKAFDQIYNDICLPNLNIKILGVGKSELIDKLQESYDKNPSSFPFPNLKMRKIKDPKDIEEAIKDYGPVYMSIDEF